MIPRRNTTCPNSVMFFVEGAMVTETEYRKHLRSQGWTNRQIDKFLKDWRRDVEMNGDD